MKIINTNKGSKNNKNKQNIKRKKVKIFKCNKKLGSKLVKKRSNKKNKTKFQKEI